MGRLSCDPPSFLPTPSATVATWPFSAPTDRLRADTTKRSSAHGCAVATASSCSPKTTASGRAETSPPMRLGGFPRHWTTFGITHPLVHDSYLINLASPAPRLWRKSVDAFVAELHRAEILGIPYVVTHPGAFTTADEAAGLRNIVRALDEVADRAGDLKARLPAGNDGRPGDGARLAVRAVCGDSRSA